MKKLTLYLTLSVSVLTALPQKTLSITGQVIDAETKAPLPFATISLDNTSLGVVANQEGAFDFTLVEGETISISSLGYESISFDLQSIIQSGQQLFELSSQPILLDEVIVSGKKEQLSGEAILKLAIKNQKKNFPDGDYALSVFFRETNQVNDRYSQLVEAAATIHGKKYPNKSKKVYIDQIRTSKTAETPKPVALQMETYNPFREFQSLTGKVGNIRACKSCSYEIESYISYQGRPAVIIASIRNSPAFPRFFRYIIDLEHFAFIQVEFESSQPFGQGLPRGVETHRSNLNHLKRTYSYQEYQGKYYLSRYHQQATFEFRSYADSTDSYLAIHDFTVITNNYQSRTAAPESEENQMNYKDQISEASKSYDPDFWKTYNILKQTPLDQKIINDLRAHQPLDSLFTKEK